MAIAVRPGHARYFLARGNSFRAINEFEAAIADFDMAISLDDKCPTYYASRGTCFRKVILLLYFSEALQELGVARTGRRCARRLYPRDRVRHQAGAIDENAF